jgi:hypothetical protein
MLVEMSSLMPTADPELRASDAEREQVAESLRRHHATGRLDLDELQQRLGQCYAAKTVGGLERLQVDLPRERLTPAAAAHRPGAGRVAALAILVLTALVAATAVSGPHSRGWHGIWLVWVVGMLALRGVFWSRRRPFRRPSRPAR